MKVLWITNNIIFPDACDFLGIQKGTAGGWMYSAALEMLKIEHEIDLGVVAVCPQIEQFMEFTIKGVVYYCLPGNIEQQNIIFEDYCRQVNDRFNPEVVQIHGCEYALGLSYVKACGSLNTVVSIQGLVSVCHRYYYGEISFKDMIFNTTIWDLYSKTGFFYGKNNYYQRGVSEIEYFKKVDHIIGRTDWDRIHTWSLNSKANYHFCNETLRSEFYGKSWDYEKCVKYSIFLSQAKNPSKGLHQVLKSLAIVIRTYPDTKIYVGLSVEVFPNTIKGKIKTGGYARYLQKLIKQLNLKEKVVFLGGLNAEQMCAQYLKSNLFISPASIENSSNSLGEAQLLGVPCIASNVGGTENIMDFGKCGKMYRFEEYEQLAYYICRTFENGFIPKEVEHAKKLAEIRHNPKRNAQRLLEIYNEIIG